jgi:hypothetical protein
MVQPARGRLLYLIVGIAICAGAPGLARSGPAQYTGAIHLRLWERDVPYGAALSGPGLVNSPSGDLVSLVGSGPQAFTLPAGQLSLTTSLYDLSPTVPTLDFRSTKFSGANDTGSFFGGGAPASTGFTPLPSIPASQFGVSFSGVPNRFGGVMRLLGSFDWRGELANCSGCPYHTLIPLSPIGGPVGGTAKAFVGGTADPLTFATITVWGFPWDTGNVDAVASVAGSASTTTSARGTDLRTASGLGTLQLVSPFLVRVKSFPPDCGGCENRWYYAGTARAEFRFVPEPAANILLAAGSGALALLYHYSSRRKP